MQKEKLDLALSVVSASLFVLLLFVAAIMFFRIYLKRKNNLIREKERMSAQFEQTLLRSKLEMQEETFTHIGNEIHDNIGQVLSLVRINLNTISATNADEKIPLMDDLLGKAITDLRNLSHSLDTDLIRKTGWVKATERLLNDIRKSAGYTIEMRTQESLPGISNEKQIILFRIIQEVLNNIIKHAGANTISLTTEMKGQDILLSIHDNGTGFNSADSSAGAGLHNMSKRAAMIGAQLDLTSSPGSGTTVMILINTANNE